ncbi:MAG TPA: EAL domain-containing protein [Devosiaceae bacterium]|nr:EAL domain-containing protein [Devosiaceae bacterium]
MRHRVSLIEAATIIAVIFTAAMLTLLFEIDGSISNTPAVEPAELATLGFLLVCGLGYFVWRRLIAQEREITARREAEDRASYLASHDQLTGLPNRRGLDRALEAAVTILPGAEQSHAVLLLDLNGFKRINDVYGHARGDEVLGITGRRMASVLREGDTIARSGGDEFAMVVRGVSGPEGAIAVAEKLIATVDQPIAIGADHHRVGTGIGIALIPRDGTNPAELLRKADIALYKAKVAGHSAYAFFLDEMDAEARERDRLQRALARAVGTEAIVPFFQPLVDMQTGAIRAFEALARWHDPEFGDVPPARFIPLAEESRLIAPLTDHLLARACEAARGWPAHVVLSFNLSPVLLHDPAFPARLLGILAGAGFPLHRLELEITENAIVRDLEAARAILGALREAGIKIALDDFGTGATSLYHLRSFKFDAIKIDRSFVEQMQTESESAAIVRALLGLGRGLGVEIVAEGVEKESQRQMLRQEGCTTAQGFLYSAAVPAAEAAALVAASPRRQTA